MGFLIISSFICSIAMGILFNIRKERLLAAGFVGMTSYALYLGILSLWKTPIAAVFFSAFFIGILGELFARRFASPSTVFVIPAIVNIVPGAGMYYTMLYLTQQNFEGAISMGTNTVFQALSIACGLIFALALRRMIKKAES